MLKYSVTYLVVIYRSILTIPKKKKKCEKLGIKWFIFIIKNQDTLRHFLSLKT